MIKTFALVAVATLGLTTGASAYMHPHHQGAYHHQMMQHHMGQHTIHADGYCNGRVDGSGLTHHCGTATGGVPGGIPGRN